MHRLLSPLVAGLATAGCLSPPVGELPVSTHFANPESTSVGRAMAPPTEQHPGDSGLYLLVSGLDAFAAETHAARMYGPFENRG